MSVTAWRERLRSPWWWLAGLAVVFPLLRLWPLNGHFMTDWINHKWLVGYSGEYLKHHGWPTTEINTGSQAGMTFPVFYGTLFYPLVGALATVFNAGVAMRIAVILVTWVQLRTTTGALRRYGLDRRLALGVAALTIWAIYPLTNLYNRSAITEYVAVALLGSTVSLWLSLVRESDPVERRRLGLGCGLCFALMAGTHPITALYSLPILVLLVVLAFAEHGRDRAFWIGLVRSLALPVALAVIVTLPWMYALGKYQQQLQIYQSGGAWFYPGIDEWATRFSPLPYDARMAGGDPFGDVSTPYLDAQINIAMLLLLVGWLAIVTWRQRRAGLAGLRAIALPLAACAFFVWISLYESAYTMLPHAARMIQLAYRAVTYQNIALMLAVFALIGVIRRRDDKMLVGARPAATAVLIGCLALSAVGVVIKWKHATWIMKVHGTTGLRASDATRDRMVAFPPEFYGYNNYATPGLAPPLDVPYIDIQRVPIDTGAHFGEPQPLHIEPSKDGWIKTNVQAFPWHHILLDGVELPYDQLRMEDVNFAVHVTAGKHTIEFVNTPDLAWRVLRVLAFATLAAWGIALGVLTLRRSRTASSADSRAGAS